MIQLGQMMLIVKNSYFFKATPHAELCLIKKKKKKIWQSLSEAYKIKKLLFNFPDHHKYYKLVVLPLQYY